MSPAVAQRVDISLLQLHRRAKTTGRAVSKGRRFGTYRSSPASTYRLLVSDASPPPQPVEDWPGYLRRMLKRDGWTVQRLADESGVNRSRLFKYLAGESGVTVDTVRRIAFALGDDPNNALRAAAGTGGSTGERDEEMELIARAPIDDDMKEQMRRKLTEWRERQRQARLTDLQDMIELARRSDG
jgi:transcriptional regulator with XRE-family HTH domain